MCATFDLLLPCAGVAQPPPPEVAGPLAVDPPSNAHVLSAYRYVRSRVDRLYETEPADPPPDIPCSAACVTLRWDGRVWRGVYPRAVGAVERATDAALAQLREQLPASTNPLAASAMKKQLEDVRVSVELAGAMVPIPARTFGELDQLLSPGLDGVCVSISGQVDAAFPSESLIAGDSPAQSAIALISRLSGDPTLPMPGVQGHEAADLAAKNGLALSRFRVTHVAQVSQVGVPLVLYRGGTVVPPVTTPALRDYASRLVAHILARQTIVDQHPQLWAGYLPWQDRRTEVATPIERALAAASLCRAGALESPLAPGALMPPAVSFSQDLLLDMLAVQRLASPDMDCATAAMLVVALDELKPWLPAPPPQWWTDAQAALAPAIWSTFDAHGSWNDAAPEPARGLVAYAMTILADDASKPRADAALRAVFRDSRPGALPSHLPWLYWAESRLAGGDDAPLPSAIALRQLRTAIWDRQLKQFDLQALPPSTCPGLDLAGGLDLDANPAMSASWQCARPLAFLAGAIRDPRLTDPPQRMQEVARLAASMRFLRQLAVDESAAHAAPDVEAAMWGVRAAPWDQRQSLDAAAMTLFTLVEAVKSCEWVARQPPALPPG